MAMADDAIYRGHRTLRQYADDVRALADQIKLIPELQEEGRQLEKALEGIVQPFEVAIFGRMKTGKSSILNAFLGVPLSVTGVNEATATINRIVYGSGEQLNTFRVFWCDASPADLPISELREEWNGKDEKVLDMIRRVAYLELYANAPMLKAVHIIDTPGTGSTAEAHEEIAQQFIGGQETDALIYVCSYEVRETDLQDLRTFNESGLSTPNPYNCVALLHKWDLTYWNNGGNMQEITNKAQKLAGQMKGYVARVLPVSAPLAFVAKRASSEFWSAALKVLSAFEDETSLSRMLSRSEKWERDPERGALYNQALSTYDMPWDSFRVMMRHLFRLREPNECDCARSIFDLSGFAQLEKMLDDEFFLQAAFIKQRQIRARVRRVFDELELKIRDLLSSYDDDLDHFSLIRNKLGDRQLQDWILRKSEHLSARMEKLRTTWTDWDYRKREISHTSDLNDHGIDVRKWLRTPGNVFNAEQTELILRVLDLSAGLGVTLPSMAELAGLNKVVSAHRHVPDANAGRMASYIQEILYDVAKLYK